ncbi:hypothetical protein [uncultured Mailhella sp.]|uniref:hypothetical protein n=1 Tax=uncultured Mailhella sp. TaxID=1981031 RepID=UPI0032091549
MMNAATIAVLTGQGNRMRAEDALSPGRAQRARTGREASASMTARFETKKFQKRARHTFDNAEAGACCIFRLHGGGEFLYGNDGLFGKSVRTSSPTGASSADFLKKNGEAGA